MIKVDLKNAVTNQAINKYQRQVQKIVQAIANLESEGSMFLGWKDWPQNYDRIEFKNIIKTARRFQRENVEVLVVIGIGGSYIGAKAAINMVQGNFNTSGNMEVIFAGESMSSTDLANKLDYVQDKNFALNVISKSGSTLESAVAFRLFKKLLEEKVGLHNASRFIAITTSGHKGPLHIMAKVKNYTTFVIPDHIGGRFSVLTAVGLFPLVCAGIDIKKLMQSAERAAKKYQSDSLQTNDAYRYAVARFILMQKKQVELLVQYEPQMLVFNEWWKQLAGESEGKNQKGLFPASAIFSTDLHSLGQFIQEGSRVLFETVMTVQDPTTDVNLFEDDSNLDKLNYLANKSVHQINQTIFHATTTAHVKVGKIPNIHIQFRDFSIATFGALVVFFEHAITMTAYLMGVNPFNQPGVEVYKQNLFKELRKVD